MGHAYTGKAVAPGKTSLWPAPAATFDGMDTLSWTWNGTNPAYWILTEWDQTKTQVLNVNQLAGTTRTWTSGSDSEYLTLQGVAKDGSPVTQSTGYYGETQ